MASAARPWEKVAVGKNMEYVIEVIRAEGTSGWRTAAHDEFPLIMDGEVTIELVKLDEPAVPADKNGSVAPGGRAGRSAHGSHRVPPRPHGPVAGQRRVPHDRRAPLGRPAPDHLGDDTIERWAEICLS